MEIARIKELVDRWGDKFLQRVFAPSEQNYCEASALRHARYTARFAAKEAVGKAMGTGMQGMSWKEIVVVKDELGCPQVRLRGRAADRADELGISDWHISLSHGRNHAIAQVLALKGKNSI